MPTTPRAPGRLSSYRAALAFPLPPCPGGQQATLRQATLRQDTLPRKTSTPAEGCAAVALVYGRERQRSRKLQVCKEGRRARRRRQQHLVKCPPCPLSSVPLVHCPPPHVHATPTGGLHKNTRTRPAKKLCCPSAVANTDKETK